MNRKDTQEKLSKAATEKMQNPEIKGRMIRTMIRKFADPKLRKLISKRTKEGMIEKGYTPEVISVLVRKAMKGLDLSGPNSASWRGGISKVGYCPTWNDREFKEYIYERDNNQCHNPYCYQTSNRMVRHHIDYDKGNCSPDNIILVCNSCNARANKHRKYWKKLYTRIMKIGFNPCLMFE